MKKPPLLFSLIAPAFVASLVTAQAAPILSEIMSSNSSTLQDEDGDYSDWIEIYNPDNTTYSLNGHFLSDDPANLERWQFPDVSIPAQGYLLLFASGKNRTNPDEELHANFALSADGEYLALVGEDGEEIVSEIPDFPPMSNNESYIAVEDNGAYVYQITNKPSPGGTNAVDVVIFSMKGQTFTDSITVELSTPSGAGIKYTTDGKPPTLFNSKTYTGPIELTQTALLAAQAGTGPLATEVFIKLAPELADRSSDIPLVVVDSSRPLNGSDYTDMAIGIIEPETGARAEMAGPFNVSSRGGIRHRGETSQSFPKKPMRFEFWDEQGDDRDLAPFGWSANSDFILNARYEFDRTLMHNVWIYYLSNQIGQWAVKTRFVELYVNTDSDEVSEADYQGVYTFMENIKRGGDRVDVADMEIDATTEPEITGGYIFKKDKDDPGVWYFSGGGEGSLQMVYPPEEESAQRGHQASWLSNHLGELRNSIDNGSDPENGYPAYIDSRAWIDHHLLNLLPLNVDALRLSAYFTKDRESKIIAGPIWDFDRSAGGASDGRVTDPFLWRSNVPDFGTHFFQTGGLGTPVWWADLFETRDFQQEWADRWHELRHHEMVDTEWDPTEMPAFSAENISRIIDHFAAEIMESQERNFARWPGAPPRNASQLMFSDKSGFEGEIEHIKGWLIARAEWIDDELIQVPTVTPETRVHEEPVTLTMRAGGTLFDPDVIYYTTDGSDPRVSGGGISSAAVLYESGSAPVLDESALVVARKYDGNYQQHPDGPDQQWSAPVRMRYFVGEDPVGAENLVVSEIMYHPADPSEAEIAAGFDDADVFEFIEFLNIGARTVNFSGARLRGDADFDFAEGTKLAPGERLLLVENQEAFALRYPGVAVDGQYRNKLGNGGGRISLRDHTGAVFREFLYDDDEPWPAAADGEGRSLVLLTPEENPDAASAASWQPGTKVHGTPGTDEDDNGGGGDEGYTDWLAEHFSADELEDESVSGPQADADGDGLPTLAEYYAGGDPMTTELEKAPTVSLASVGNETFLALSYRHLVSVEDVTATVELSSDLQTWLSGPADTVEVERVANGDGSETITVRDAMSLTDLDGSARFARLRLVAQ